MKTMTNNSRPLSVKLPLFLEAHRRSSARDFGRGLLTLAGVAMVPLLLVWLLPLRVAFLVTGVAAGSFVTWVLLDSWQLRRRHARLAKIEKLKSEQLKGSGSATTTVTRADIAFEQWMEGVNREVVRRGYVLKARGSWAVQEETFWRWHFAHRRSAAEAVDVWEEEG